MNTRLSLLLCASTCLVACTLPHSKQAVLDGGSSEPSAQSRFVTEEDSGVSLFGIITFSEPDHYAVLLERARRSHRCGRMHHAQLDYYTDHWIVLAFLISRVTVICDPEAPPSSAPPSNAAPSRPPPAPATALPAVSAAPVSTAPATETSPPEQSSATVAVPSAAPSEEVPAP